MFQSPFNQALRKQVADKFNISMVSQSPAALQTLISSNTEIRNNMLIRFALAAPIAIGGLWLGYTTLTTNYGEYKTFLTMGALAAGYMIKTGRSIYIRQWMVNNLQEKTVDAFSQSYIARVTQNDISNNIYKTRIIPTEAINTTIELNPKPSFFSPKTPLTPLPTKSVWNINDHQILGDTLRGKYNSSDYILYPNTPMALEQNKI